MYNNRHRNKNKKIVLPPLGLNVSRSNMPQLGHQGELKNTLKKHNIRFNEFHVNPKKLKAVQGEFDADVVHKVIDDLINNTKTKKPKSAIVISKDNYVIDGNHRWLAHYNTDTLVKVLRVDLPVLELMNLAKTFKNTTYKDIKQVPGANKVAKIIRYTMRDTIKTRNYK